MAKKHIPLPGPAVHLSKFLLGDLKRTGVYFLYDKDELVYVGQTRVLKFRLDQHLGERAKTFDAVAFIPCTIDQLSPIEGYYINKYAPKYNKCGIAKRSREMMAWRKAPPLTRIDMEIVDASDLMLSPYEASDLLNVSQTDLNEWRLAGLLPKLSVLEAFQLLPQVRQIVSPKHQLEIC